MPFPPPGCIAARRIALNRPVSVASVARVPRRAPSHAGTRASRSVAPASAAGARIPRSSLAGHNRPRKNFLVITLAPSGAASSAAGFRLLTLPVTPALPVALLFAGRRGPVALLRLPPRPCPRRLPARLAAIALPRPSWPKAPLTSFEQTQSRPRSARQPFSRAARLIFGMACCTLGRAQGRSLLPEAPAPEGIALLSGAQQIFGSIRDQQLYRNPRALPLRRSLFPRHRRRGCDSHRLGTIVSFEISSRRLVASRRHSPLAEWSPPARQNGAIPRRR